MVWISTKRQVSILGKHRKQSREDTTLYLFTAIHQTADGSLNNTILKLGFLTDMFKFEWLKVPNMDIQHVKIGQVNDAAIKNKYKKTWVIIN